MERALQTWLVGRGGSVKGVRIQGVGGDERGLVFSKAAKKGATVVSVPLAACGGSFRGARTAVGSAMLAACEEAERTYSPIALAALWLCEEAAKGAASEFAAFVASLPRRNELRHLPLFWDNETLKGSLRGSPLLDRVDTQRRSAARWYAEVCRIDATWSRRTAPETWAWAVACVLSRTFRAASTAVDGAYASLAVDEPATVVLLVPVVDMLNHASAAAEAPAAPCAWAVTGGAFVVSLTAAAAAGAEATIEYFGAARAPSNALLSYGFCAPYQTAAEVEVRLPVPPDRPRRDLFARLERDDAHAKRARVACDLRVGDGPAAATALSLCRVTRATAADLAAWRRGKKKRDDAATLARAPKTAANEKLALDAFLSAVLEARGRYGAGLPADADGDARLLYARLVRKCELKVLDHFELLARLAIDMLDPLLAPDDGGAGAGDDSDDEEPMTLENYAGLLENQLDCDENLADDLGEDEERTH